MARPSTLSEDDMLDILRIAASISQRHQLSLTGEISLGAAISQTAIRSIRKAKRDA